VFVEAEVRNDNLTEDCRINARDRAGGDSLEMALARLLLARLLPDFRSAVAATSSLNCFNLDAIRYYLLVCGRNERKKIAVL
jgi:hypothetical protein